MTIFDAINEAKTMTDSFQAALDSATRYAKDEDGNTLRLQFLTVNPNFNPPGIHVIGRKDAMQALADRLGVPLSAEIRESKEYPAELKITYGGAEIFAIYATLEEAGLK